MYHWINEGTPFPGAAYHQWITEFYQENKLFKGTLEMDGRRVDIATIDKPLLNVAASADSIAPRSTTSVILDAIASKEKEELLVEGGHVGIVVGRAAKHNLWPRVADWLVRHD
jgi:polyhydroxyalkanoate synthase